MSDAIHNVARSAGVDVSADFRLKKAEDAKKAARQAAPGPSAGLKDDKVELSDTAKRVMSGPDFDATKVDRIKKAIQEGSYPVDARKVAQSFAELEKLI